jgi:hypothetical protein
MNMHPVMVGTTEDIILFPNLVLVDTSHPTFKVTTVLGIILYKKYAEDYPQSNLIGPNVD